jgi:two-component system, response regulator PdtaR
MSAVEHNPAIGWRPAQLTPITVLIAEDDDLVRELGVELLSDAGFQVLEATNGEDALSMLEGNPNVRVLFTDINMPGPLDGFTLASLAAMQWPHLAILICSGNLLPRSGRLPRGIVFISKPYDPESAVRLIREMTTAPA